MKMKICEVFTSFQGEGYWMGTPAAFIRFAGCNIHCPFCFGPDMQGRYPWVLREDGNYVRLDTIDVGDVLLTLSEDRTKLVPTTVQNVSRRMVDRIERLQITNAGQWPAIYCTGEHPFMRDYEWVPASMLQVGDLVERVPRSFIAIAEVMEPHTLEALHKLTHELLQAPASINGADKNGNYNPEYKYHNFARLKWMLSKGEVPNIMSDEEEPLCIHHLDGNHDNDNEENLVIIPQSLHNRLHARGNNFGKAISIDNSKAKVYAHTDSDSPRLKYGGPWEVINLTTDMHTFVVQDILVHNCDESTKYKNILDWDEDTLHRAVEEYEHVIFTGGEPMLQVDAWRDFAKDLYKSGHFLHLETNGTLGGVPKFISWVTCSPKESGLWKIRVRPDEIKLVVDKRISTATIQDIANMNKTITVWLQPCDGPDLDWSMDRIQHLLRELPDCKNLRAGIQMHKYYNVR